MSAIKKEVIIGDCRLILGDCLEVMPLLGEFDAVVTDPPYGINYTGNGGKGWVNRNASFDSSRPKKIAFDLLRDLSSQQIIWGGNYFSDLLPPSMQWLVWDKGQRGFSLADCEFAWSSQERAARVFDYARAKALKDIKVHATQKPIELMEWCINHLPDDTKTILDPFMGSGTTGVACVKLGRKFTGIELDSDYFEISCDRIRKAYEQPDMFVEPPSKPLEPVQDDLLEQSAEAHCNG